MKKRYALLLPNSEYREMKFAHLPVPGGDWEEFAQWLRDPRGGGFQGVEVVSGATQPQTMLAIERFFNNKGPDDTLLLWFGGQAIIDAHGETFLCLRDSDRLRLKSTAIMAGVLGMHMDMASTKDKLLVLDCRFHTFLANKQDLETRPVFRPERAFTGRGNSKHILIGDSELYVHTFVEAEHAARPVKPFTHVITSIWQEMNDELQGLSVSELFPILCRRLGMHGKPEWFRIGDAQDLVLAPAARTEMVATLGPNDGPRKDSSDLNQLDWDRLSGEIPLDILGLGLGNADRSVVPPLPPQGESSSGGWEPPTEHEKPKQVEPEPESAGSPFPKVEENIELPAATLEIRQTPEPAPAFPPVDFLSSATMSMPSPEAMEIMEEKPAAPKLPEPPAKLPQASNRFTFSDMTQEIPRQEIPEMLGMVTQISNWSFDPDEKPAKASPLSTTSDRPNESLVEKLRREMEAEAEREKADQRLQEEEVRKQAEALERWKESHKPKASPPAAEPSPAPSPIALPMAPPPTQNLPAWIPPEVQQTQMMDAESGEAIREAAAQLDSQPRPILKANVPAGFQTTQPPANSGRDLFAATQMYVAENPEDESVTPVGLEPPPSNAIAATASPALAWNSQEASQQANTSVPSPAAALGMTSGYHAPYAAETSFGSGLERPPSDLDSFNQASLGLKPAETPWVKIALVGLSIVAPLAIAAWLLVQSGLVDRLSGNRHESTSGSVIEAGADLPVDESLSGDGVYEAPAQESTTPSPPKKPRVDKGKKAPSRPKGRAESALTSEDAKAIAGAELPTPVNVPEKVLSPGRPVEPRRINSEKEEEANRNLKVALQNVVGRESAALQSLYDRYAVVYPDLKGVVNIRLEIGADGRIRKAKCVLSTTELSAFDTEVARAALRWKLLDYKGVSSKIVTLPLHFPLTSD
jgi:hypothetical protein